MSSTQLVYWQAPCPPKLCRRFPDIRSAVMPKQRAAALYMVGSLAQFDEVEDDEIDELEQVPVRYRGRVMAAPIGALRPVL
ncbi:hypothetical protein [Nocardia sp. NBC_01009]|uniref:hypothetical protein n=1 Tax=Nocardia sp. NBC_01009 TaxID=2975996 RepID=UPI0038669C2A|nr:hypothetical protein OHA42_04915 [Nocardia sp. NBC_01009]